MNMKKYFLILFCLTGVMQEAFSQEKKNEFELSSAGMPPVYHYVAATNKVEEILIEGLPLGGLREEHFDILKRSFNKGDIIVQLSDGLPEAPNLLGELYDYERLHQLIE